MPAVPQRRQFQVFIDRVPDAVFAFLTNLNNHSRLCAPEQPEEVLTGLETPLASGTRIIYRWKRTAIPQTFIAEVTDWDPPHGFSLRQVEGPFTSWIQRTRLTPFQGGTLLADQIEVTAPTGPLGLITTKLYLGTNLDKVVQYRHAEAKRLLERIGRIKGRDAL